jgi:hypothetical protein
MEGGRAQEGAASECEPAGSEIDQFERASDACAKAFTKSIQDAVSPSGLGEVLTVRCFWALTLGCAPLLASSRNLWV